MNGEPNTPIPAVQPPQDVLDEPAVPALPVREPLVWTSSGSLAKRKSAAWYMALLAGSAVVAALVYLISKDTVSAAAIVVATALFGSFGIRQPRAIHYTLDESGITVGQKHFMFAQFRSFSIIDEGGYEAVILLPLKRFSPLLPLSYDPQLHGQIVDYLAAHLPLGAYKRDALDALSSRIKL